MLISTFGPPSGYTQFCLFMIRALAEEVLQDLDYIAVDEIDQMRAAWAKRQHPHVLFFSYSPERAMVDVFLKLDRPLLILTEHVDDITTYIMRERGQTWPWAVRLTHQCLFAINDLMLGARALILRREYELTFAEFFQAIATHFQIELEERHMFGIMARANFGADFALSDSMEKGLLARWEHARPMYEAPEGLSRTDAKVIEQINAPLKSLMSGRNVDHFFWPQEIFIPADTPNEILIGPIEMLGPARCLSYGPYLHLPMGRWDIAVELAVEANLSGNRIEIQFVHGSTVVSDAFDLPKAGSFLVRAHLDIDEPRAPLEIRIFMREGAIEGRLDLKSAVVDATDGPAARRAPNQRSLRQDA